MSSVFHGLLMALWKTLWWMLNRLSFRADGARSIVIRTIGPSASEFDRLCERYGSDKGGVTDINGMTGLRKHNYTSVYELLLRSDREGVKRIFECGIGSSSLLFPSNMGEHGVPGASLFVWRDYFPFVVIDAIDIDMSSMIDSDRIRTFVVDQTSDVQLKKFVSERQLEGTRYDLMIDDGLHTAKAAMCLYENVSVLLKAGGLYIIEDLSQYELHIMYPFLSNLDKPVSIIETSRKSKLLDNDLMVVIGYWVLPEASRRRETDLREL